MKEIILSISEVINYEIDGYYSCYDGFKIQTNQQEIYLLISNYQDCCESFGYFVCDDDYCKFIDSEIISVSTVATDLNKSIVLSKLNEKLGWQADNINDHLDCGGVMFVEIMTNIGPFQFAAYNSHNGYYGHNALIVSKDLNHEVVL